MADGVDDKDATTTKQVETGNEDTLAAAKDWADNKVSDLWENTKAIAFKEGNDALAAANKYTDKALSGLSFPQHFSFSNKDKGAHVLFEIPNNTTKTHVYLGYHCDAGQFFIEQQGEESQPFLLWFSHLVANESGTFVPIATQYTESPSGYQPVKNVRMYLTEKYTATDTVDAQYTYNRVAAARKPTIRGIIDISGYLEDDRETPFIHIKLDIFSRGKTPETPYNDDGGIEIDMIHRHTRLPKDHEPVTRNDNLSDEIEVS